MSSIRKMFAIAVLASVAMAGCHKKPAPAAPTEKAMSPETGATGGAAYGGQKPDATPPAPKDDSKSDK
jgi:hypothetical protein